MRRSIARLVVLAVALSALATPGAALAGGPAPIPAPDGFAELRAQFEGKSGEQIVAMGYIAEPPVCISEPGLGGMGVHALKFPVWSAQFPKGVMDAKEPPIVLLDASLKKVIGLEWEAADLGQGAPSVFGQPALLLPGHPGPPGTEVKHYMLHAHFRANGEVLFAPFDPQVTCPKLPNSDTEDAALPVVGLGIPVLLLAGLMLVAWFAFDRRLRARR